MEATASQNTAGSRTEYIKGPIHPKFTVHPLPTHHFVDSGCDDIFHPWSCSGVPQRQRIPPRGPQTLVATVGQQNVLFFFCCFSSQPCCCGLTRCLSGCDTPERLHGPENVTRTNIHKVEVVDTACLSLRHSCFLWFLIRLPLPSGITRQGIYTELLSAVVAVWSEVS